MFNPNGVALDIFGDKATSDARRRCQPAEGDEDGRVLLDMHLSVATLYMLAYAGWQYMVGKLQDDVCHTTINLSISFDYTLCCTFPPEEWPSVVFDGRNIREDFLEVSLSDTDVGCLFSDCPSHWHTMKYQYS